MKFGLISGFYISSYTCTCVLVYGKHQIDLKLILRACRDSETWSRLRCGRSTTLDYDLVAEQVAAMEAVVAQVNFKQVDDRVEKLEKELAELKRELELALQAGPLALGEDAGQDGRRRQRGAPLGWPQEQASRRQESPQPHSRRVIRPSIRTDTAGTRPR
jgi:hypothetical protein